MHRSTNKKLEDGTTHLNKKLVVGADNFGRLSLYHHPAPDTEAGCVVYRGHGGVTNDAVTNPFKGTGVTRLRFRYVHLCSFMSPKKIMSQNK